MGDPHDVPAGDRRPWTYTPPPAWQAVLLSVGFAALFMCAFDVDDDTVKLVASISYLAAGVARLVWHWRRGRRQLPAIPVADEIPAGEIGEIIDRALADADRRGVTGKDITPYLLGRIVEITDGASLGLIETDRSLPTSSSCGTRTLPSAMMTIQPRMIGSANVLMRRGSRWRTGFTAGPDVGMASVVGSLSEAR